MDDIYKNRETLCALQVLRREEERHVPVERKARTNERAQQARIQCCGHPSIANFLSSRSSRRCDPCAVHLGCARLLYRDNVHTTQTHQNTRDKQRTTAIDNKQADTTCVRRQPKHLTSKQNLEKQTRAQHAFCMLASLVRERLEPQKVSQR